MPVPETPQQKINYMAACQRFFVDTPLAAPSTKTSVVLVEGEGTLAPPRFVKTNDLVILPKRVTFSCAICGRSSHAHGSMVCAANPYSRWTVLQCSECAGA